MDEQEMRAAVEAARRICGAVDAGWSAATSAIIEPIFDAHGMKMARALLAAEARVARLTEALRFYADENRYDYDETCCPTKRNPGNKIADADVLSDSGVRARAALAGGSGG